MSLDYKKIADSIEKKCRCIIKAVNDIHTCIENKEFGKITSYEGQLASASRGLPDAVNRLISATGNDPVHIMDQYAAESCNISLNGEIVNIRFGNLLPHKEKRGMESYASSLPYIRAFYKESKTKLQDIHYDIPVVLAFIHHYVEENEMVDHDNLLYKPFIDAISVSILKNDSPRQCSHFMGHMMDSSTFSEIYVLPAKMFAAFLSSIF